MKRFIQHISELFDRPFAVTKTSIQNIHGIYNLEWRGVFGNPEVRYFATATPQAGPGIWDFYFTLEGQIKNWYGNSPEEITKLDTAKKNIGGIFATTLAILTELDRTETVNELHFTADKSPVYSNRGKVSYDDSRAKLYIAMIKRFASAHGFHLKNQPDLKSRTTEFVLVRKAF